MVSPLQFPPTGTTDDDRVVHLFEEAEAGKPSPTPDEDTEHVLFEEDAEVGEGSTKDHRAALVSEDGVSVLMEAVAAGDREQIQTALHWGLDVNSPDPHHAGQTPLHLAARFGRPEIIALLLNAGADAAFRDADLRTPLEIAILHEQTEAARQLMAHTPQAVSLAHPNLLRMNGASEFRCATAKN